MKPARSNENFEKLNTSLNDSTTFEAYKKRFDDYRPGWPARLIGNFVVISGNIVFGREPSYLKFRAVEVIARVPYHSWTSAIHTIMTFWYLNESKVEKLFEASQYAYLAQDNETMHLVVISHLAHTEEKASFIWYTLMPAAFAFLYFWTSYVLYLMRPHWSLELNYIFESHAFAQYDRFLDLYEATLKNKPVLSDFLSRYGRYPQNQYEFFRSIRNDELIHRNESMEILRTYYP